MKNFENRLGKLEGAMTPIQVVGPVIYTFWAPCDVELRRTGPKLTGARASFPGFEGLSLELRDGENLESFEGNAKQVFEELLTLKLLPEPEASSRIEAKTPELLGFEIPEPSTAGGKHAG
ncbi:MAG: hypothetical protein ABNH38_10325 [Tateyamaria sp.]|jgi:hypothetical protein|uniref:hypothetical protein n=1 Tax=Tateyamaria sp. TaxID=1929288 RepID=UPI0032DC45FE